MSLTCQHTSASCCVWLVSSHLISFKLSILRNIYYIINRMKAMQSDILDWVLRCCVNSFKRITKFDGNTFVTTYKRISAFLVYASVDLLYSCQRFGGIACLYLQIFRWGKRFIWNAGNQIPDYILSVGRSRIILTAIIIRRTDCSDCREVSETLAFNWTGGRRRFQCHEVSSYRI